MLGNSLLSQFGDIHFRHHHSVRRLAGKDRRDALRQIDETPLREGRRPLVFSSIVDDAMSEAIRRDPTP